MTEADRIIADYDREIGLFGEMVTLQRMSTDSEGEQTPLEVDCPAKLTLNAPQDIDAIGAADSLAVITPTPLALAGWPAPPREDDRIVIGGRDSSSPDDAITATVDTVTTQRIGGQAVRYTLRFRT